MNTIEIATKLVELCKQGRNMEALDILFADDVVSVEAVAMPGVQQGEMTLDGQRIMMGQGSKAWRMVSAHEAEAATQGIFIYLADADAHYERARAAGAEIVKPPEDLPYGRSYTARDPDGHPWFFTTPPAER